LIDNFTVCGTVSAQRAFVDFDNGFCRKSFTLVWFGMCFAQLPYSSWKCNEVSARLLFIVTDIPVITIM